MNKNSNKGNSFIRPADAWALGLGTSIGWGSLVITSSTYLFQAGPAGSIIGLVIGTVIMLVIAYNYHYMINCYPDRGGAYAYAREVFGNDQAFLTGWFMILTYFAMLWANATSLPLFARYFIGDIFKVGRMYSLFGYDVYLGEVLISACVLALTAFIMIRRQKAAMRLMTVLAGVFTFCIMICFVACLLSHEGNMEPAYIPEKDHLAQVIKIASISPWAFIGFENISNASEEFTFSRKKTMRVLTMAVITAAILYGAIIIMSVTAYPPEYSS